jgi:hypothetical protein
MAPMVIRHAARRVARAAHRLTAGAPAAPTGVRALSVLATGGLRGAAAAPSLLQRGALMPATALPIFLSARAASSFTTAYNQQVAGTYSLSHPPCPSTSCTHPTLDHQSPPSIFSPHSLDQAGGRGSQADQQLTQHA